MADFYGLANLFRSANEVIADGDPLTYLDPVNSACNSDPSWPDAGGTALSQSSSTPLRQRVKASDGTRLSIRIMKGPIRNIRKTISDVKPKKLNLYPCTLCGSGCSNAAGLASHTRAKHPESWQRSKNHHRERKTAKQVQKRLSNTTTHLNTKAARAISQPSSGEMAAHDLCRDIVDTVITQLPIPALRDALDLAQKVIQDEDSNGPSTQDHVNSSSFPGDPTETPQATSNPQPFFPPLDQPLDLPQPYSWKLRLSHQPLRVTQEDYIRDIPYPDILLISQGLVQKQIRGDGHCIVRAVLEALSYTRSNKMTLDKVLQLIHTEVQENQSHYTDKGESIPTQISDYIMDKQYTTDAADLIPGIMATALNINICIVSINSQLSCDLIKIPPGRLEPFPPSKTRPTVTLIRTNADAHKNISTHYDVAIPQKAIRKTLVRLQSFKGDITLKCPHTNAVYHMFRSLSRLSNFSPATISLKTGTFSSNEQNIMFHRFPKGHPSQLAIMGTDDPRVMKKEGKKAPKDLQNDVNNAFEGMWAKYHTNSEDKKSLLATKNHILVEGTHNRIWGIGRDITWDQPSIWADRTKWADNYGIGILGVLSMVIREDIRNNRNTPSWDLIKLLFALPSRDTESSTVKSPTHPPITPCDTAVHSPSPPLFTPCDTTDTLSASQPTTNNTPLYSDVIKSPAHRDISTTRKTHNRILLPMKGMYIPPKHMSAKHVVSLVRQAHPSLGRHLQVKEGKITSEVPDVQQALKLPLIPLGGLQDLRQPLPRALPDNTHVQIWLTDPIPLAPFNPLLLAASHEVVSVTKYESDGEKGIFKVSTAFLTTEKAQVQPETKFIEIKGGACIQLTKFVPVERCTVCQSLDHNKWSCVKEFFTCVFCAEHHFSGRCPLPHKSNYKCGRCKGPHKASSVMCPDYVQKLEEQNLPSLGETPDCSDMNNNGRGKTITPLLECHLPETRIRELFPGNSLNRARRMFRRKNKKSPSPSLPKNSVPTRLMDFHPSKEHVMQLFGLVSSQFQGYAPFPIKSYTTRDVAQNQPLRHYNQTNPNSRLDDIACDLFKDGHLDTVISVLSRMCGKTSHTSAQYSYIAHNSEIMKLFREASSKLVRNNILPLLIDTRNFLRLKYSNPTPTFTQHYNPNLIYIRTTEDLSPSHRYNNPNLIQIQTSN